MFEQTNPLPIPTGIAYCLCDSVASFTAFVEAILASPSEPIGYDAETDSQEWPDTTLVGFSLYSHELKTAMYVPVAHEGSVVNLDPAQLVPDLTRLFEERQMVAHAQAADAPLFLRLGVPLHRTACTYARACTLQARDPGLKDLVLAYRLVDYRDVKTYLQIIAESRGVPVETLDPKSRDPAIFGFHTVDVAKQSSGLTYACNDSIWARHLLPTLDVEHDVLVGNAEQAALLRWANDETTASLCEATAQGYLVNPELLTEAVQRREALILQDEHNLLNDLRRHMGWPERPLPAAQAA